MTKDEMLDRLTLLQSKMRYNHSYDSESWRDAGYDSGWDTKMIENWKQFLSKQPHLEIQTFLRACNDIWKEIHSK